MIHLISSATKSWRWISLVSPQVQTENMPWCHAVSLFLMTFSIMICVERVMQKESVYCKYKESHERQIQRHLIFSVAWWKRVIFLPNIMQGREVIRSEREWACTGKSRIILLHNTPVHTKANNHTHKNNNYNKTGITVDTNPHEITNHSFPIATQTHNIPLRAHKYNS